MDDAGVVHADRGRWRADQVQAGVGGRGENTPHRIIIVGGGAAGLELATRLGDRLGRRRRAEITLIDRDRTHLWKPLLHEVAAGCLDLGDHELDYLVQSHWHHFRYRMGQMIGLDRSRRVVVIGAVSDGEGGEITGQTSYPYDTLIIAVGSGTNDFGTPGVREHACGIDTPEQATRFHRRLVNAYLRAHGGDGPLAPGQLQVAIIGAGATGVELAAQLRSTAEQLIAYGLDRLVPEHGISLHLIEAADRVLPALPEHLSTVIETVLRKIGVQVHTSSKVAAVSADSVQLADGRKIPAELIVWAAGVKAPEFLAKLDGLETNRINQLVVRPTLQTSLDDAIFALGDCASAPWLGTERTVPPRAQAAHQQASHLYRQIRRHLAGKPLAPFQYRDFGSLVSLGQYSTVGTLMGKLVGGSLLVEGYFARFMYLSLYKLHALALHGPVKVGLDTLARMIQRRTGPAIKLH
jgi:NADH dehydrogenase